MVEITVFSPDFTILYRGNPSSDRKYQGVLYQDELGEIYVEDGKESYFKLCDKSSEAMEEDYD